jgi:Uma2 family endonuclease
MTLVTAKWSLAEYHQMIAAEVLVDRQVELINGEIIEMSPEGPGHSYYCRESVKYLRSVLAGWAEVSEAHPITIPDNSEPEPDIAIIRLPVTQYRQRHPLPADIYWLVEIANTTLARDLTVKKDLYATAGIPEYWVIDLQNMALIVFHQLQNGHYQTELQLTSGTIAPQSFPAVQLEIQRLLS